MKSLVCHFLRLRDILNIGDWISLGSLVVYLATLVVAIYAYKSAKSQVDIANSALEEAKKANQISGTANSRSEEANKISVDANTLAVKANTTALLGNEIAENANGLAQEAISKAEESNNIARQANLIAAEQPDVRFKIFLDEGPYHARLSRQPPLFSPIVSIVYAGFSPIKDVKIEFQIARFAFEETIQKMERGDKLTIDSEKHKDFYEAVTSFYNSLVGDYFKMEHNESSLGVESDWLKDEMKSPKTMRVISVYTTESGAQRKSVEDVPFKFLESIMSERVQDIVLKNTPGLN